MKVQDIRERKVLATAEAQMEPEKVPCGASSCSRWLGRKDSGGATLIEKGLIERRGSKKTGDYYVK